MHIRTAEFKISGWAAALSPFGMTLPGGNSFQEKNARKCYTDPAVMPCGRWKQREVKWKCVILPEAACCLGNKTLIVIIGLLSL